MTVSVLFVLYAGLCLLLFISGVLILRSDLRALRADVAELKSRVAVPEPVSLHEKPKYLAPVDRTLKTFQRRSH